MSANLNSGCFCRYSRIFAVTVTLAESARSEVCDGLMVQVLPWWCRVGTRPGGGLNPKTPKCPTPPVRGALEASTSKKERKDRGPVKMKM